MGIKVIDRIGNKVLVQGRRNGVTYRKWVHSFHSVESKAAFGKRDCKLAPKLKRRFIQSLECDKSQQPAKMDSKWIRFDRTGIDNTPIGRKERTQIACESRKK